MTSVSWTIYHYFLCNFETLQFLKADQYCDYLLGVVIHQDCTLARWNDGDEETQLRCATFTTNAKPIRVDCQVSVSYHSPGKPKQLHLQCIQIPSRSRASSNPDTGVKQ